MDSSSAKIISLDDRRRQTDFYNLSPMLSDKSQDTVTTQPYVFDRPIWGDFEQLKQKVARLEQRIAELEQEKSPATYIELRDVSYPQVKEEIAQYFLKNDGKEIGYEELIEELRIDPQMVVQACNELHEEGKIG